MRQFPFARIFLGHERHGTLLLSWAVLYLLFSHDLLYRFCLRKMLGAAQRQTLFPFLDATAKLLQERQDVAQLTELEKEMKSALALLERDFPASIQVCYLMVPINNIPTDILVV